MDRKSTSSTLDRKSTSSTLDSTIEPTKSLQPDRGPLSRLLSRPSADTISYLISQGIPHPIAREAASATRTPDRALSYASALLEQRAAESPLSFLKSHGLSRSMANSLLEKHNGDAWLALWSHQHRTHFEFVPDCALCEQMGPRHRAVAGRHEVGEEEQQQREETEWERALWRLDPEIRGEYLMSRVREEKSEKERILSGEDAAQRMENVRWDRRQRVVEGHWRPTLWGPWRPMVWGPTGMGMGTGFALGS